MQKMNFNTRYGMTDAVISGRKTEDREVIRFSRSDFNYAYIKKFPIIGTRVECGIIDTYAKYKLGEVVAVAQSYENAGINPAYIVSHKKDGTPVAAIQSPGWNNKMFTRANLMPHQIRITDIRIERLQDITDESCLREGIQFHHISKSYYVDYHKETGCRAWLGSTPREAFESLIDKVSVRGTWESNPYVVVYEFELVK
ncbi:hypothetical protein [uncultured Alistipes sp.]|uniref:hypothetical protein n=1 Tax=uncultured Alistipes sp. TaxID=538949 RepID=UPI00266558E4|nr:hypothetical protein [uncultured Alistipes sp.]